MIQRVTTNLRGTSDVTKHYRNMFHFILSPRRFPLAEFTVNCSVPRPAVSLILTECCSQRTYCPRRTYEAWGWGTGLPEGASKSRKRHRGRPFRSRRSKSVTNLAALTTVGQLVQYPG